PETDKKCLAQLFRLVIDLRFHRVELAQADCCRLPTVARNGIEVVALAYDVVRDLSAHDVVPIMVASFANQITKFIIDFHEIVLQRPLGPIELRQHGANDLDALLSAENRALVKLTGVLESD